MVPGCRVVAGVVAAAPVVVVPVVAVVVVVVVVVVVAVELGLVDLLHCVVCVRVWGPVAVVIGIPAPGRWWFVGPGIDQRRTRTRRKKFWVTFCFSLERSLGCSSVFWKGSLLWCWWSW